MRLLLPLLSLTFVLQTTLPYEWVETGLTLEYPATWDSPVPTLLDDSPALQMAEVLADTPIDVRPAGIPTIMLLLRPGSDNLTETLRAELEQIGIDQYSDPISVDFLNGTAQRLTGTNTEGVLFGIAQAAALNSDEALVLIGRSASSQETAFTALFDSLSTSIQGESAAISVAESYGILWYTQRTIDDAEDAFLNLIGLALGPDDQLYSFEADLGVVQIDRRSGRIAQISANPNILAPSDLAVTPDGSVYVSDVECNCIFVLSPDGTWLDMPFGEAVETEANTGLISGFGPDSPAHMSVSGEGLLYVSNVESDGSISLRVFDQGILSREIPLPDDIELQPLLAAAADGTVMALGDLGQLLSISDNSATPLADLGPMSNMLSDFALTPEGNLVITAADEGVTILSPNGEFLSQPLQRVDDFPTPGQAVAPSATIVDSEGVIYVADSDGFFGAVTALSTGVAPDRLGAEALIPSLVVQGLLSADRPSQQWTYEAEADNVVTVSALDNLGGTVDLALRLLAPDGSEIAANNDHSSLDLLNPSDAQIAGFTLAESGLYTIVVEAVEGDGTYSLGLSLAQAIEAHSTVGGELSVVFPAQQWRYEGSARQTVTITLTAISTTLDPILRVYGPDGEFIDENDDAEDASLGFGSQLTLTLPVAGTYTIEAARFDGGGTYELLIE